MNRKKMPVPTFLALILAGAAIVSSALADIEPPSGVARPIPSAKSVGGSRWSADGKSIYFLSTGHDGTQIYRQKIGDSGEPKQITQFAKGVSSLDLSPDETRLLLSISDNELRETGKDKKPQPIVVTRRHFKRDAGNGYIVDGDEKHLYVYNIEEQKIRQLTSGHFNEADTAWSPDSFEYSDDTSRLRGRPCVPGDSVCSRRPTGPVPVGL